MLTAAHCRQALDGFERRLDQIDDTDWQHSVPYCPDWNVQDLVGHVTEETAWVAPLLRGTEPGDDADSQEWGDVSGAARRQATAAEPETVVQLPSGPIRAGDYLAEVCCDTFIHTWDHASAIDGDTGLDPDLVTTVGRWFDTVEDEWRTRGAIGPPADIPADADDQARLLARFGRTS